jgi:shikimate dehydrogenase
MTKYPGIALDQELISPNHWVSEIVYVPLETELLRVSRAKGCQVLDGSGMAVFQAVGAFEYFTGLPANPERMQSYFNAFELA